MMRALQLIAIAIVSALVVGCGDAAPVVTPTPEPSPAPSVATPAPTATVAPSDAAPTASPSGSPAPATPSPSPTLSTDWTALRWAQPVWLSAHATPPEDILLWQGAYLAVGSDRRRAAAWTSPDFVTWTPASVDGLSLRDAWIGHPVVGPDGLISLGVHGRLHCDAGEGATCDPQPIAIWTSSDGRSWHGRAAPRVFKGATIAAVAAGPDGIVAVGDSGWDPPAIWFSPDGETWRRESLPAAMFRHAEFWGLTHFRDRWVLTGLTDPVKPECCTGSASKKLKAAAWFSADGRSWKRASVESPAQETIGFPFATSGGLASGGYKRNWVSADGSDWQSGPTDPDFGPVASDGERIVGYSQGDDDGLELWVSTDGRSWQVLADAGDASSKPSWGVPHAYFLLPTGLAIVGSDASLRLAQPTSAP
jgi:hypothetical protein